MNTKYTSQQKDFFKDLRKTMTKKAYNEFCKSQRSKVTNGMNTGTRTMKSSKDYNRRANKEEIRKMYLYA